MDAIVFLVQRIGPYHHARLRAFAAAMPITTKAIEFRTTDTVYAWEEVCDEGEYQRFQTRSRGELISTLDRLQPQAIVCVGYSDPEIHQAMAWALRRHVPLVTCSDSTYEDEPRNWPKEAFKRWIVAAFETGLVAGTRAHDYLGRLGKNHEHRFAPWDVVDNAHFECGADLSREHPHASREKLKLPARYFLCVARFVPKKNLARLIESFVQYVKAVGEGAWSLVLSGAGPLEPELRTLVATGGLGDRVHFLGFLDYPSLPICYGLAEVFVLPSLSDQWGLVVNEAMAAGLPVVVSSRCGCAPDLVKEGENGFTFEPENSPQLTQFLIKMTQLSGEERAAMGRRSREIIRAFSPEAFARGLEDSITCALKSSPQRVTLLTRLIVQLLARRTAPIS